MKRVLFVDDEHESLEALKGMLQRQGLPWEAAFATNGKSALDLLAENHST
jgi:CheY-like chemotaxis protein